MTMKLTCDIIRIVKLNFVSSVSYTKLNVNDAFKIFMKLSFIFVTDSERSPAMVEYNPQVHPGQCAFRERAVVPAEDAEMIRKVYRILKSGRNVEIRQDARGKPKVFRVSKEIE